VRTVVVVQARMGSTRLPGKVLADVAGRPLVAHVLDRAQRIRGAVEVALAIPDLAEDDPLARAGAALGVRVVRGSSDDVLDRYLAAAEATRADAVVRVTGDCPLLSPAVASDVLEAFPGADYASNTLERTFPRGLDTEVISVGALRVAGREATSAAEREHVTPFIWRRPERFALRSVRSAVDRSALRWTVDTPEDLELVRAIHAELGPGWFDMPEIVALLERRPELAAMNAGVAQKPVDA
jgi:spore coat polysaccharide biosynthesis protein SpsF